MVFIGLLVAFFPIFQGLFSGLSIGAIIAGMTLPEWGGIAGAIAGLFAAELEKEFAPQIQAVEAPANKVVAETKAKIIELLNSHPAFARLVEDVQKLGPEAAAKNAFQAAQLSPRK